MKRNVQLQPNRALRRPAASGRALRQPPAAAFIQRRRGELHQQSAHLTAQRLLSAQIHDSPRMVAQRQQLERAFGIPVQLQGHEEEELQMKAAPGVLQRQGPGEDEELLQGKFTSMQRQTPEEEEQLLQGEFANKANPVQLEGHSRQETNRTGMPDQLKAGVEALSGLDMSNVRVHYGSDQPSRLNALAYTQGTDIHVAPGQERHVPHEAWHVVQQAQGRVQPTMQAQSVSINDDAALEHEADVMGAKALQMRTPKDAATRAGDEAGRAVQRTGDTGEAFQVQGDTMGASGEKVHSIYLSTRGVNRSVDNAKQTVMLARLTSVPNNTSEAKQLAKLQRIANVDANGSITGDNSGSVVQRAVPEREKQWPHPQWKTGTYSATTGMNERFAKATHPRSRFSFGKYTRNEVLEHYPNSKIGNRIVAVQDQSSMQMVNVEAVHLDHKIPWQRISAIMDHDKNYTFAEAKMYYNDQENLQPVLGGLNVAAGASGIAPIEQNYPKVNEQIARIQTSWMNLQNYITAKWQETGGQDVNGLLKFLQRIETELDKGLEY